MVLCRLFDKLFIIDLLGDLFCSCRYVNEIIAFCEYSRQKGDPAMSTQSDLPQAPQYKGAGPLLAHFLDNGGIIYKTYKLVIISPMLSFTET
jgi:hypothetical protein